MVSDKVTCLWKPYKEDMREADLDCSKMEYFVIIVNSWKPLTVITTRSILDIAAALAPPLYVILRFLYFDLV